MSDTTQDNNPAIYGSDDTICRNKFVYCTQHMRVHSTGWCTVSNYDKVFLLSETAEDAKTEWEWRKQSLKTWVFDSRISRQ